MQLYRIFVSLDVQIREGDQCDITIKRIELYTSLCTQILRSHVIVKPHGIVIVEKKDGSTSKLPSPSSVLESLRHTLTYYRRRVDELNSEVSVTV